MKTASRVSTFLVFFLTFISLVTFNRQVCALPLDRELTDQASLLKMAREMVRENDLDAASCYFSKYRLSGGNDRVAILQQARVEAWRGNHARSRNILDQYRKVFGEDREYRQDLARLMAWADLPTSALELVKNLLNEDPGNFDARFTKGIALRKEHRPKEALVLARELQREKPSRDTDDLYLMAWTPTRSYLGATLRFYSDDDEIDHYHSELFGVHFTSPSTSLGVRIESDRLSAQANTGLENIDGSESEEHQRGALEIWHRFSPWLAGDFSLGASQTGELEEFPTCRLNIYLSPFDIFDLRLTREYGYYMVSPRSVSADVRRTHYQAEATWRPGLRYTVVTLLSYDDFSDDNDKWLAVLSPRRAFLRTQYLNLDLGIRAWLFGFDRDLNNGYYDPEEYESYMVTAMAYWKIDRDNGLGLYAAAGILKDDRMRSFEFGWDATLEGSFGIYRNWMLKAFTSIMNNQRRAGGAFDAHSIGLTLLHRF